MHVCVIALDLIGYCCNTLYVRILMTLHRSSMSIVGMWTASYHKVLHTFETPPRKKTPSHHFTWAPSTRFMTTKNGINPHIPFKIEVEINCMYGLTLHQYLRACLIDHASLLSHDLAAFSRCSCSFTSSLLPQFAVIVARILSLSLTLKS